MHTKVCLMFIAFHYNNGCTKASHCSIIRVSNLPVLLSSGENEKDLIDYFLFQNFCRVLYVVCFFWVNSRRLNFICRRFGTLSLFQLHKRIGTYPPIKMEQSVSECQHIIFARREIT
jgi:hypothetical protein